MKYKFKPFSKNVIFLDTEFSTNDPYVGEILSIGLAKYSGEELYLELEYDGPVSDWVKKNIIPTLKGKKVSRKVAVKKIREFVGDEKPFVISYVNAMDTMFMFKLFGIVNVLDSPFYWIPIDFASILFGIGLEPISYIEESKSNLFKKIGVDTSKFKHTHNALDDARLLREVYLKMVK